MPDRLRAQTITSYSEELFLATIWIHISYLFQQFVPQFRLYKILGKKPQPNLNSILISFLCVPLVPFFSFRFAFQDIFSPSGGEEFCIMMNYTELDSCGQREK